jgi:hypothetical protein
LIKQNTYAEKKGRKSVCAGNAQYFVVLIDTGNAALPPVGVAGGYAFLSCNLNQCAPANNEVALARNLVKKCFSY